MATRTSDDPWERTVDRGALLRGAGKLAGAGAALGLGAADLSLGLPAEAAGLGGPLTFWNLAADGYEQPDKVGFLDLFRKTYPQVQLKVQYVPWAVYLPTEDPHPQRGRQCPRRLLRQHRLDL
jgi:hypothetical protein